MSAGPIPFEMASSADILRAGYEDLRREAVRRGPGEGRSGRGLALVLARGVVAWMLALPPLAPSAVGPGTGSRVDSAGLPDRFREELTQVLVSMVFERKAG